MTNKRVLGERSLLDELIRQGIAYYHAGLTDREKHSIKNAYLKNEIKVVASTATLAPGLDFKADVIIFK